MTHPVTARYRPSCWWPTSTATSRLHRPAPSRGPSSNPPSCAGASTICGESRRPCRAPSPTWSRWMSRPRSAGPPIARERREPAPRRACLGCGAGRRSGLAMAASAALALLVVRPARHSDGTGDEAAGLRAKSASTAAASAPERWAGIGVYRVTGGGPPQRLGERISRDDGLLFTYTNLGARPFTHLMIFAVDGSAQVRWFYPAYQRAGTNPASISIEANANVPLAEVVRHPFATGPATFQALFSRRPLRVEEVEAWLAHGRPRTARLPGRHLSPDRGYIRRAAAVGRRQLRRGGEQSMKSRAARRLPPSWPGCVDCRLRAAHAEAPERSAPLRAGDRQQPAGIDLGRGDAALCGRRRALDARSLVGGGGRQRVAGATRRGYAPHASRRSSRRATAAQRSTAPIDDLFARMRAAVARGEQAELLVFYSGHGDVAGGEGYVVLEDRRVTRGDLHDLLARSPAARNHVFVDACKSYFMAFEKGPGGQPPLTAGRCWIFSPGTWTRVSCCPRRRTATATSGSSIRAASSATSCGRRFAAGRTPTATAA